MPKKTDFYFYVSVLLLIFVLLGFSRTLYLAPLFEEPALPLYLYVHGAATTAWFVLAVVQPFLIRSNRVALHRKIGWMTASVGAVVVVFAALVPFVTTFRFLPAATDLDADVSVLGIGFSGIPVVQFLAQFFWGNFIRIALFAVLLCAAIAFRHRAEAHKRLMLFASINLVGPAVTRIARWPVLGGEEGPFIAIVALSVFLCIVAHDLYSRRRVHPATAFGLAVSVLTMASGIIVANSPFAETLVRALV